MQKRYTELTVVPDGEPIFHERGFTVRICDEAGGEFVRIDSNMHGDGSISVEPGEWSHLREAIDDMMTAIRHHSAPTDTTNS